MSICDSRVANPLAEISWELRILSRHICEFIDKHGSILKFSCQGERRIVWFFMPILLKELKTWMMSAKGYSFGLQTNRTLQQTWLETNISWCACKGCVKEENVRTRESIFGTKSIESHCCIYTHTKSGLLVNKREETVKKKNSVDFNNSTFSSL